MTATIQLELFQPVQMERPARAKGPCEHRSCFHSCAFVPAGCVCSDCGELLSQHIPQPPEVLGYLSADWKWHYIAGLRWVSSDTVEGSA